MHSSRSTYQHLRLANFKPIGQRCPLHLVIALSSFTGADTDGA